MGRRPGSWCVRAELRRERVLVHAGLLQKVGVEGQSEVRMEATPVAALQTLEKQFMAQLQHKATETWNYPGDSSLTSNGRA